MKKATDEEVSLTVIMANLADAIESLSYAISNDSYAYLNRGKRHMEFALQELKVLQKKRENSK